MYHLVLLAKAKAHWSKLKDTILRKVNGEFVDAMYAIQRRRFHEWTNTTAVALNGQIQRREHRMDFVISE